MHGSVFGKYQLLAQLGEGGMAEVFLAVLAGPRGSGFSKLTVIKKLREAYEEDPEFISMLVDEAGIAARLNHPNVVQILEIGDVEGKYFMAMEYLDGQSFHRVQNRVWTNRKKPGGDTSTPLFTKEMEYVVLLDVLSGLHHAHELADYDRTPFAIVHRDVTPHNVFVTYDGQVKVVDFGIAKAAGRGAETRHGVIKGKMRYMPPEQALGKPVDRRADIFSVGVLLWETATGERRWKDQSEVSIMRALIADESFISPRGIDPSVPEEIDAICKKALAHDPADRYQTAEELRTELERYLAKSGHLLESRSRLPAAMATLFADKRSQLNAVIEKRLSVVNTSAGSEVTPMMLTLHANDHSSRRMMIEQSRTSSHRSSQVTAAPRTRSWTLAAGLIAAATVFAGTLLYISTRPSKDAKPDAVVAVTAAHAPVTPGTEPALPPKVMVSVAASPPGARIFVDGAPVASPYEAAVDRSSATHVVRIEADGFEPQTKQITFERDLSMNVALGKSAPTAVAAGPRFVPAPQQRSGSAATAAAIAKTSEPTVVPSHVPAPAPAAAEPTATATGKPKKDIDRANPFAGSQAGGKGVDKSNPFEK